MCEHKYRQSYCFFSKVRIMGVFCLVLFEIFHKIYNFANYAQNIKVNHMTANNRTNLP